MTPLRESGGKSDQNVLLYSCLYPIPLRGPQKVLEVADVSPTASPFPFSVFWDFHGCFWLVVLPNIFHYRIICSTPHSPYSPILRLLFLEKC